LVIGRWSLVVGHWSLVVGHWSLVVGRWSLVVGRGPRNARQHRRPISIVNITIDCARFMPVCSYAVRKASTPFMTTDDTTRVATPELRKGTWNQTPCT
jgi:hypothetical protein